jgi:hypothetical protein
MTKTQAHILALFQTLPVDEQRSLAATLAAQAAHGDFELSPEQHTELEEAKQQVRDGKVLTLTQLDNAMQERFGFSLL